MYPVLSYQNSSKIGPSLGGETRRSIGETEIAGLLGTRVQGWTQ